MIPLIPDEQAAGFKDMISGCDLFISNDKQLKQYEEVEVLIVDVFKKFQKFWKFLKKSFIEKTTERGLTAYVRRT